MATPLRVLVVEDSEDDALLLVRELHRGGFAPLLGFPILGLRTQSLTLAARLIHNLRRPRTFLVACRFSFIDQCLI